MYIVGGLLLLMVGLALLVRAGRVRRYSGRHRI
jgi:hypothetical protein